MHRLLTLIIALAAVGSTYAQNTKFGKPTAEEWSLTSVDFAPDAAAVVLYKSVEVNYTLSGEFNSHGDNGGDLSEDGLAQMGETKHFSPSMSTITYDVKLRTKILTEAGKEYSAIDIISLNDKDDMDMRDEYYDMSVLVLSSVNGKIKKKRLTKADFVDERLDDHYFIRHVRVPDVKVGDIIEYQYKLFSNRSTYIYNTQMQESIPVLYAKCKMEIPYFLQFNVNTPQNSLFTGSAELGHIAMPLTNDMQMPRKCPSNVFTIEGKTIPAYDGVIDLSNVSDGKVFSIRTELQDKTYDVIPEMSGPVRHLIIGK